MSSKKDHAHKLVRHRYTSGSIVYLCVDDCSFKSAPEFLVGRKATCHRCGQTFKLTKYSLSLKKPHCSNCHKHKTAFITEEVVDRRRNVDRRGRGGEDLIVDRPSMSASPIGDLSERLKSIGTPTYIYIPPDEEDEDL